MTYKETLRYLFTQLPMFQRVGNVAFKKDLTNIKKLCLALGNPQRAFKTIHIAGTNGKGSTAHLLASVLQESGYQVGLYTSPHYKDFRERIKVNGQLCSKQFVVDFVAQHQKIFEEIKPSFFEITVAMAFEYFKYSRVELAVIETGLGGRLDSTNILRPMLSIITNISFDHQEFLGDTLPKIAREKAGIIKKGIPVIIGEEQAEVREVFEKTAARRQAPLIFASRQYKVRLLHSDLEHSYYEVKKRGKVIYPELKVNLHGAFQARNIATALCACDHLSAHVSDDSPLRIVGSEGSANIIRKAFENLKERTYYIGRWQLLSEHPRIIADSAHNEAGLQILQKALDRINYDQLHFVLGMVGDKSREKVLSHLPKNARYYFAKADIPRGLDAKKLQSEATQFGLRGKAYSSVKNALRAARRAAQAEDLIFIGGSIFVVAEVL